MKYTRLSLQDLKDLEKEFVEFLIINGITADEWEKIKSKDKNKTEKIIEQFSDVVWEGILRRHSIVEKRSENKLTLCKVENGQLVTLYIQADEDTDFTQESVIDKVLKSGRFDLKSQTTLIEEEDNIQLFKLLQLGFYLSNKEAYNMLFQNNK